MNLAKKKSITINNFVETHTKKSFSRQSRNRVLLRVVDTEFERQLVCRGRYCTVGIVFPCSFFLVSVFIVLQILYPLPEVRAQKPN